MKKYYTMTKTSLKAIDCSLANGVTTDYHYRIAANIKQGVLSNFGLLETQKWRLFVEILMDSQSSARIELRMLKIVDLLVYIDIM